MAGAGVAHGDIGGTEWEGLLQSSKFIYLICSIWAYNCKQKQQLLLHLPLTTLILQTSWIPLKNE